LIKKISILLYIEQSGISRKRKKKPKWHNIDTGNSSKKTRQEIHFISIDPTNLLTMLMGEIGWH